MEIKIVVKREVEMIFRKIEVEINIVIKREAEMIFKRIEDRGGNSYKN